MNVEQVRAQNQKLLSERNAEAYVLKAMQELDESSTDAEKRAQAERKVEVMGTAYQHVVDGRKSQHEAGRIVLNGVVATVAGLVVAAASDSRIFPRIAESVMKAASRRV